MNNYKEYLSHIHAFVLDVDGVLTDGTIQITSDGQLLRTMNTKDGFALKYAVQKGYKICIISGGNNPGVKDRLKDLGITDMYFAHLDKKTALEEFMMMYELQAQELLYMGDDLPDLEAMQMVGLAACPQDAAPEIKKVALYVSHKKGGKGCVRDVVEQVLRVRGDWPF